MPSTMSQSLYNVIEERRLPEDRLPTREELDQTISALDGVQEFLTGAVASGCIKVGNDGEANAVDYEQIGHLASWANHVRGILESITTDIEKVSIVALQVFPIQADGCIGDGTPYDEYGSPDTGYSPAYLEKVRRRMGFRDAS